MPNSITNEIILFHVEDRDPAMLFEEANNETLLELCIKSIQKNSPSSIVKLITNAETANKWILPEIEVVIDQDIKTDELMYSRTKSYFKYVKNKIDKDERIPIAFLDIDILVTKDFSEVYNEYFDLGVTYRIDDNLSLDSDGIHNNTQVSPINGGVLFLNSSNECLTFIDEWLHVFENLSKNNKIKNKFVENIKKWGGDQYALMNILGKYLHSHGGRTLNYKGIKVKFFPCDTYNYSPSIGKKIDRDLIKKIYVLHMKGPRKKYMKQLAEWLSI
jgi:hypothetical protein